MTDAIQSRVHSQEAVASAMLGEVDCILENELLAYQRTVAGIASNRGAPTETRSSMLAMVASRHSHVGYGRLDHSVDAANKGYAF